MRWRWSAGGLAWDCLADLRFCCLGMRAVACYDLDEPSVVKGTCFLSHHRMSLPGSIRSIVHCSFPVSGISTFGLVVIQLFEGKIDTGRPNDVDFGSLDFREFRDRRFAVLPKPILNTCSRIPGLQPRKSFVNLKSLLEIVKLRHFWRLEIWSWDRGSRVPWHLAKLEAAVPPHLKDQFIGVSK